MLRMELSDSYGARLVTDQSYRRGQLIHRISRYRISDRPTYQTVQIAPDAHIEDFGVLVYLNHSCRPNTWIDTTRLVLLAEREIAAGDELTFFYPSTEWAMDRPFVCLCGAPECAGYIAGAKYFPPAQLRRYLLSPHIRALLGERERAGAGAGPLPPLVAATPPLSTRGTL